MTEIPLPQNSRAGSFLTGPSKSDGTIQIEAIVFDWRTDVGEVNSLKRETFL